MTEEKRRDHAQKFRSYAPTPTDFYSKSQCVGKKPGNKIRKRNLEEPTFIEERVEKAKLPKVTIKKNGEDYTSTVKLDLKKLNPKANITKEMELRLKTMHKAVTR